MPSNPHNEKTRINLLRSFDRVIRDPVWTSIAFDGRLEAALRDPSLARLRRIKQLGPAELVYPGATHTRYSHSLGVLHVAYLMLLRIMQDEACPDIAEEAARSFLAAALLHDIGHFPYAHSLKELPLAHHEDIGAALMEADASRIVPVHSGANAGDDAVAQIVEASELPAALRAFGADPAYAAAILCKNHAPTKNKNTGGADDAVLRLFRRILSGALDPDKLDYLCRDAFFCGVPYGTQDAHFAVRSLRATKRGGLYATSAIPAEHILFSKYLMYKSVYWHEDVRAATAMVKHALFRAMRAGSIAPHELLFLDDNQFRLLCEEREQACPSLSLAGDAARGRLHRCEAFFYPEQLGAGALSRMEDLEARSGCEDALCTELGEQHIVIDVPENVQFESPLLEDDAPHEYDASHGASHDVSRAAPRSVFSAQSAPHFIGSLRIIRVFAPRKQNGAHQPERARSEKIARIIKSYFNA